MVAWYYRYERRPRREKTKRQSSPLPLAVPRLIVSKRFSQGTSFVFSKTQMEQKRHFLNKMQTNLKTKTMLQKKPLGCLGAKVYPSRKLHSKPLQSRTQSPRFKTTQMEQACYFLKQLQTTTKTNKNNGTHFSKMVLRSTYYHSGITSAKGATKFGDGAGLL